MCLLQMQLNSHGRKYMHFQHGDKYTHMQKQPRLAWHGIPPPKLWKLQAHFVHAQKHACTKYSVCLCMCTQHAYTSAHKSTQAIRTSIAACSSQACPCPPPGGQMLPVASHVSEKIYINARMSIRISCACTQYDSDAASFQSRLMLPAHGSNDSPMKGIFRHVPCTCVTCSLHLSTRIGFCRLEFAKGESARVCAYTHIHTHTHIRRYICMRTLPLRGFGSIKSTIAVMGRSLSSNAVTIPYVRATK
jgi:hypothetical protein